MVVNPFWSGFLIGIIVTVILIIFIGTIGHRDREKEFDDWNPTEEEYQQILEDVLGKQFRVWKDGDSIYAKPMDEDKTDEKK